MSVPASLSELVDCYYAAYNAHDVDAILALQTSDAEYRLHGVAGTTTWVGVDACREVYEHHLRAWPDQRLDCHGVAIDGNLCVCHVLLTGTLALPWRMAGRTYAPTGRPVTFELVHVLRCEGNLVRIKDGWVDGLAIHNQLVSP